MLSGNEACLQCVGKYIFVTLITEDAMKQDSCFYKKDYENMEYSYKNGGKKYSWNIYNICNLNQK